MSKIIKDNKLELEKITWRVNDLLERYDPENDVIVGAPRVTATDEATLSAILALIEVVKALAAEIEHIAAGGMSGECNE